MFEQFRGKPPELEASGGDGVPLAVPLADDESGEGVGGLVGDADEEFPAVRVRAFDGDCPGSGHVHPAQQVAGGVRPACPCDDHGRVSRRDVVGEGDRRRLVDGVVGPERDVPFGDLPVEAVLEGFAFILVPRA